MSRLIFRTTHNLNFNTMKTKHLLAMGLLLAATSASAQIQLLYTQQAGRNVIDRNKKLFWMEGDSDPCFKITNYKKTGNKETFTLVPMEGGTNYSAVITLGANSLPTHLVLKYGKNIMNDSEVKTTSGSKDEDDRMYSYFGELAGYPAKKPVGGGAAPSTPSTPSVRGMKDVKDDGVKGTANKVGESAKEAFGKVKGLFKKKK